MKIVKEEGFEVLKKKYDAKIISGYLKTIVKVAIEEDDERKDFRELLIESGINYFHNENIFSISFVELSKVFSDKYLSEERIWCNEEKIFLCKNMSHQHLSNCVHYLEIMMFLERMNKSISEIYLVNLKENIFPELTERFNDEILEYVPFYELEKSLYKEYLKKKSSQS